MDHREQESTPSKEEETVTLSSVVPPSQVTCQEPLLSIEENFTSGQVHIQPISDKYINEANFMTKKTDLWGKIILNTFI